MSEMFFRCKAFDQDLSKWGVVMVFTFGWLSYGWVTYIL
jgi:hypothetical protein